MIPSSKVNSLAELDALVGEHVVRESPEIHWEDSHGTFQFDTEPAARKALHDPYYQNFLPDVDWTTTMVREVRIYRCYASDPSAFWKMVAAATDLAGPLQLKRERGQWAASFGTNEPVCAHSPQIAVCLAALASRNITPVVDHARVERQLALIMEQPLSAPPPRTNSKTTSARTSSDAQILEGTARSFHTCVIILGAMKFLLLILAAALPLHAATSIEISAKLADIPAGTEIASATKLEKIKGVNVLSAPRIVTTPGESGTIEITQAQSAPGGASVPLGVSLQITPTLDEKNINFSGRVIDRAIGGKRAADRVTVLEFATREVYFSGSTNSGQTVLLRTSPAVSRSAGKTADIKARELVILLTFSKHTSEPQSPKKVPAKVATPKSGASKKAPATKITPAKKK